MIDRGPHGIGYEAKGGGPCPQLLDTEEYDSAQRQNQRHRLFVSIGNQSIN